MNSTLVLEHETKLHKLLPMCAGDSRLEASGVLVLDDRILVAFDNFSQIASLPREALTKPAAGGFMGPPDEGRGFEAITRDPQSGNYYLLQEAVPSGDGFRAQVVEWSRNFRLVANHKLDFLFQSSNKGFEGLVACLHQLDGMLLLALCEGNRCRGGAGGRKPGGGRIQVFRRVGGGWEHTRQLKLPGTLPFRDYAGICVKQDRVGVVSQSSAAVWVGRLDTQSLRWTGAGQVFELPRTQAGKKLYGNAEGIDWLDDGRLVIVSDRWKKTQSHRSAKKAQSIHVFQIPNG